MSEGFTRSYKIENEPLDITAQELADLLDAGLDPTEIDRLRFTRWRLQTRQLEGDRESDTSAARIGETPRSLRWA